MDGELAGLARFVFVEGLDDLDVLRLGTGCTGRVTKSARERDAMGERDARVLRMQTGRAPRGRLRPASRS